MFKDAKAFSGFSVPDLTVAKKFYGETLGLDVRDTPEGGLELRLVAARVFIYISETNKPAEFTILNFVIADIEKAVDELIEKGVKFEQYDLPYIKTDAKGISRGDGTMGPRAIAWFKDPAGNILSVLQEE